jgi:hypothetical protein
VSSSQVPFEARKEAGNVGGSHAIVQVLELNSKKALLIF